MAKRIRSTPRKDGFRMPGEFEPQEKIWMIWPERPDTWRDGAKPAQKAFVEVARAISAYEPMTMLVSAAQYANARNQLPDEVRVVEMSTDDAWCRDCGPTFVKNDKGEVRGVDWEFNAWGGLVDGCYFPWASDNAVVKPGEVACIWTDDPADPFYEPARAAYETLCRATDAKGRRLKVHKLCLPKQPVRLGADFAIDAVEGSLPRREGDVCIASYANFLIVNGGVIVPLYGDENDPLALQQIQAMFPERKVVGVYTREVVYGGGNIHCITQQQVK